MGAFTKKLVARKPRPQGHIMACGCWSPDPEPPPDPNLLIMREHMASHYPGTKAEATPAGEGQE